MCLVVVFAMSFCQIKYYFPVLVSGSKSLSKLEVFTFDYNLINGSKLRESLQAFSSIRVLSMKSNKIIGTINAGGKNTFDFSLS